MYNTVLKLLALNNSDPLLYDLDMTPEEAETRFKAAIGPESEDFNKHVKIKFLDDGKFRLFYRLGRNGWRRRAQMSFETTSYGTCLIGQYQMKSSIILSTFFFLNLTFWIAVLVNFIYQPENRWAAYFLPLTIILIPNIGRYFSLREERKVIELFKQIFSGHIIKIEFPREHRNE